LQDPALISNVTGYKPYELMMQNDGNIKWPTGYLIPANSSDEKGALLGYVSGNFIITANKYFAVALLKSLNIFRENDKLENKT
jgi:hypothetical protein